MPTESLNADYLCRAATGEVLDAGGLRHRGDRRGLGLAQDLLDAARMRGNANRPARSASTQTSLAALKAAVADGPVAPAARAGVRPGTARRPGRELPRRGRRPVAAGRSTEHPVRPGQPQRDRDAHGWRGRLRDGRAVDKLDHRVHNLLRVDDDVDRVVRQIEEPVRLDGPQRLVDQGRAVDGDDRARWSGRVRAAWTSRPPATSPPPVEKPCRWAVAENASWRSWAGAPPAATPTTRNRSGLRRTSSSCLGTDRAGGPRTTALRCPVTSPVTSPDTQPAAASPPP